MVLQTRASELFSGLALSLVKSDVDPKRHFLYFIYNNQSKAYLLLPGKAVHLYSELGGWLGNPKMEAHMLEVANTYAERLL